MGIIERWEKALKETEIVRSRIQPLLTNDQTKLPYIFLAESSLNLGDSVVRKGHVFVEKPSIILPDNLPHFDGFEFDKDLHLREETVTNFFLVRGIRFPSYTYNNKTDSLDIFEGSLKNAIKLHKDNLQRVEDVHTGLIVGPESCWQFSVLIFICSTVSRYADRDIKRLLEDMDKKGRSS